MKHHVITVMLTFFHYQQAKSIARSKLFHSTLDKTRRGSWIQFPKTRRDAADRMPTKIESQSLSGGRRRAFCLTFKSITANWYANRTRLVLTAVGARFKMEGCERLRSACKRQPSRLQTAQPKTARSTTSIGWTTELWHRTARRR